MLLEKMSINVLYRITVLMDSKVFDDKVFMDKLFTFLSFKGSWLRNVHLMVSLQPSIPLRKPSLRTKIPTTHYSRTQFPWYEDFKQFKNNDQLNQYLDSTIQQVNIIFNMLSMYYKCIIFYGIWLLSNMKNLKNRRYLLKKRMILLKYRLST